MHLIKIEKLCLLLTVVVQNLEIGVTLDTLGGYRFIPEKDNSCYPIYSPTENINALTCKKVQKWKRSCVTGLANDSNHCSIYTPSNESIIVPCTSYLNPTKDTPNKDFFFDFQANDQCFSVVKQDTIKEVCIKSIDGVGRIITTPDNYTVLIESSDCEPMKRRTEIDADNAFVINFKFDPEENFCYQIYPQDYDLYFVYSCSDYKILKSCEKNWDKNKNCTVIKSSRNDIVILKCDDRKYAQNNCLDVYKRGKRTKVCLEEFEEGCVGFILPSGLKMLVACRKCIQKTNGFPLSQVYNKYSLKQKSNFFRHFFQNETKHKNSYFKNKFEILYNGTRETIYPYWLSNTCYGLTLPTNETVTLQCTDKALDAPGCFLLTSPNGKKKRKICANIVESCVILKTTQEIEIILSCLKSGDIEKQNYLNNLLAQFNNGSYHLSKMLFRNSVYRKDKWEIKESYEMNWLHNYKCHGLVTEDLETVLLDCPNGKSGSKNGCFKIYVQKYGPGHKIVNSSQEEYEACVKIINENCLGIITSYGWLIELACYLPLGYPFGGGVVSPKVREPTQMF